MKGRIETSRPKSLEPEFIRLERLHASLRVHRDLLASAGYTAFADHARLLVKDSEDLLEGFSEVFGVHLHGG